MSRYEILKTFLSFLPLIWLLVSLGKIKMPAYRAGIMALFIAIPAAVAVFGMSYTHVFQASLEGLMLAVHPILWVIVSALFVYNITLKTGGMEKIKLMLSGISPDRRVQALILAFSFGGFLEAVAGFGTAVAIPAGILASMGFNPLLAATVCLVANTIPVAFGVLGVPIVTLAQVTSLSLDRLSIYTALQLVPFIVFLPAVLITMVTGSIKKIRGVVGVSIASGIAFAVGQTLTAVFMGPESAAVTGALASLLTVLVWIKLRPVKNVWMFEGEKPGEYWESSKVSLKEGLIAWSPYILILLLIFVTRFIPALAFLSKDAPFVLRKQFYFGPGGGEQTFPLAAGGGTVLFISAILGGLIQGTSLKLIVKIFADTVRMLIRTIVTVIAIVVLAKIMSYSGMVGAIAGTLAAVSGSFYPVIAPLIGAIGTFITGSDTSSNVLFGGLQKQTALQLGINQEWLVAANASGATAGKMISPQSISIATAGTGLSGYEGKILGITLKYCIVYVLIMGLLVYGAGFLVK